MLSESIPLGGFTSDSASESHVKMIASSQWFALLVLPLLVQDGLRLVKRRRALPRNNQLETHRNDEPGGRLLGRSPLLLPSTSD